MCWHSTRQIHRSAAPLILFIFFECGLSCPSKRTTHIIRVRASVPRIVFIGLAVPPNYSSAGFGPSHRFLRASNAFTLFEFGLQSLESFYSGQLRLCVIRVRALVPRIILFGPAAPLRYSTTGFGPSNYSLRASSVIFHKYRGSCVAFSISKSVEPNEELKVG
jgi:hypothetical protein